MKEEGSKRMRKGKEKVKGKTIIGITMATIMLACLAAMAPPVSAQEPLPPGSYNGLYNYITLNATGDPKPTAVPVLIGQDVWLFATPRATNISVTIRGDPTSSATAGKIFTTDALGKFDTSVMTVEGVYYVNSTGGSSTTPPDRWDAMLAVANPTMTLDLKSGGTSVSSITENTTLQIDFSNNLHALDMVSLVITDPDDNTIVSKNGQNFAYINVSYLTSQYGTGAGINTAGWKIGSYTFKVQTKQIVAKNIGARGLEMSSNEKTLSILKSTINIEADKTSVIELASVKLTVTGRAGNMIQISTSDPAHTIFPGGMYDNPAVDTTDFLHTIDADGKRTYGVKFNTTGSYTITVTDLTVAGTPTDTVDITVSRKRVTFDVPSTVVIGEKLTIKGTSNTGTYVTIAVEDTVYSVLDRLVLDANKQFSKEIDTSTACGGKFSVPGSVRLKAFIDRPSSADTNTADETDDGTTVVLMSRGGLTAELSTPTVAQEDDFTISGTARGSKSVDIVIISPNGSGGTKIDGTAKWELCPGQPPVGIYMASVSVSEIDHNFSKKIYVGTAVDTGSYLVVVLSKGADNKYGKVGWAFLADALCEYSLTAKTQDQILTILEDATWGAVGSDDLMWIGYINITVKFFDTESPKTPYPSISGIHNGTITPSHNISVSRLFTYSCSGTGGHTEYVKLWNSTGWNVIATWNGYQGDWHNITLDQPFTLQAGTTYNYIIRTGSYPQIHHTDALLTPNGWMNCTEFVDANGKRYTNWIPAIKLH